MTLNTRTLCQVINSPDRRGRNSNWPLLTFSFTDATSNSNRCANANCAASATSKTWNNRFATIHTLPEFWGFYTRASKSAEGESHWEDYREKRQSLQGRPAALVKQQQKCFFRKVPASCSLAVPKGS